jgi:O-methyltransferase involved in polyketide biosynthesis
VIEVASGLSPRGWRFSNRFGDRITYIETDLPDMAAAKREALVRIGSLSASHRVEEVDALRDDGPASLAALAERMNPDEPVAIVTEGLLGYFERDQALGIWRRFARTLTGFRGGVYLGDIYFAEDMKSPFIRGFRAVISAFVRGRVHVHFENAGEAEQALADAGFARAAIRQADELEDWAAPDRRIAPAHVVEARL